MCAYISRPEVNLGWHSSGAICLVFETGSPTDLVSEGSLVQPASKPQELTISASSALGLDCKYAPAGLAYVRVGSGSQALTFAR